MYRVDANTVEEYFTADPERENDLRAVDRLIREMAPALKRHFFAGTAEAKPGMAMKMIGYGTFQYRVMSSREPVDWPVTGLALQKNYISLYFSTTREGRYIVEDYAGELGKVSIGKNCVRFKTMGDLNDRTLASLLKDVEASTRSGEHTLQYGRVAQQEGRVRGFG